MGKELGHPPTQKAHPVLYTHNPWAQDTRLSNNHYPPLNHTKHQQCLPIQHQMSQESLLVCGFLENNRGECQGQVMQQEALPQGNPFVQISQI
jgi:hypothetical protein